MGHVKPTLLNTAFTNSKEFSTFNRAVYGKYKKEFKTFFFFSKAPQALFLLSALKKIFNNSSPRLPGEEYKLILQI